MRRKKSTVKYFHKGPYPVDIGVIFSLRDARKEFKKLEVEQDPLQDTAEAACTWIIDNSEGRVCLVYINLPIFRKQEGIACIGGLCAHEATHVWQHVKEYIGEKAPALEQEAYYIQYITQCLLESVLSKLKIKDSLKGSNNG